MIKLNFKIPPHIVGDNFIGFALESVKDFLSKALEPSIRCNNEVLYDINYNIFVHNVRICCTEKYEMWVEYLAEFYYKEYNFFN